MPGSTGGGGGTPPPFFSCLLYCGAMKDKRLYLAVAACAVVVHIGALWNQFAMDDPLILGFHPMVRSITGCLGAFVGPYFPANFRAPVFRALPMRPSSL